MLSRLFESSKESRFGAVDISIILESQEQALKSEVALFSQSLDKILEETLGDSSLEEAVAGIVAICHADRVAARTICWLRLVSVIRNSSPSSDKLRLVNSFSETGRLKAQNIVAKNIASSTGALATRLLSSRIWTGDILEKALWEGNPSQSPVLNCR